MASHLNSGFKMPLLGLGVWRMEGKDIKDLLLTAIKIGYRHFDCAGTALWHYSYCYYYLLNYCSFEVRIVDNL